MLQIEFDYNSMMRMLRRMKFDNEVLICQGDAIVLSNGPFSGVGKKFDMISVQQKMGYKQTITLHGAKLDIYVLKADNRVRSKIVRFLPILGFLVIINVVLPMGFVLLLNHSFTKRIRGLSKVFQSVNGEHLVQMAHEDGRDEIGSMIRNYNRMVKRTNELIQTVYKNKIKEQEILVGRKNAELLALQSQINPHFLYNTLDTIVWLVEGGMQQDAVDMITSLSVFFRTSLSKGKDIIPLSEEKRHTLSYLEIQQSRYRDIMEFEINIPPELDEVMVPKLTLQPLAENALYHGIKNKRGKGKILIEGFNLGDDMMLRVTDNGQGMTPERLYEVQEAIRTGERAGFGLAAVSERIVLYYGPGYGLKISSTEGEGTVMEVYMAKKINLDNNSRTVLWPADRDLRRSAK